MTLKVYERRLPRLPQSERSNQQVWYIEKLFDFSFGNIMAFLLGPVLRLLNSRQRNQQHVDGYFSFPYSG